MSFVPDRRPIQIIWTGPNQWSPEQIEGPYFSRSVGEQLANRPPIINDPRGPRFVIAHPASWLPPPGDHQGAHYHTLSEAQREAYLTAYSMARKQRRLTLGLSINLQIGTPYSLGPPYRWPQVEDDVDRMELYDGSIRPWSDLLAGGLYECWLESAAGTDPATGISNVPNGIAWFKFLANRGIRSGIEGVPLASTAPPVPDFKTLNKVPSWCTTWFPDVPLAGQELTQAPEAHVLLLGTPAGAPTKTVAEVRDYLKRGYIVGPDQAHDAIVKEAMG